MLRSILSLICFIVFLSSEVNSARILGVFPAPSISHQFVFRAYYQELAKRGHELVVITPNPALPTDRPPDNITEINVGISYELFKNLTVVHKKIFKRGVISDIDEMSRTDGLEEFVKIVSKQFDIPEVKNLIEDKTQHFDLIIAEAFFNFHLIVGKIFKAPVILISSWHGMLESYEAVGAVSRHPLYYPSFFRNKFRNLSFCDKIKETYNEYKLWITFKTIDDFEEKLLKERFGPNAPTIRELKSNVDLLFLNSHPIFALNRPVPPNVVYLGKLHMQPVKDLPPDLKSYLDNSSRGVVYVSLGTNVRPSEMDKDFLDAFLDAFKALPYDILWKFDVDNLDNVPKNVKIQKWFPQRDLLVHPNIKVFVSQGGLQSTDEAIDAGVPLVGIPFLGDQWFNVNIYLEFGIGVAINAETMVASDLIEAVETVLSDKSYRENIKHLRLLLNDQPQTPMERAVWWTEHVLRHGGAKYLRAAAANISWSEYLMLDILGPVLVAFLILILVALILIFYTVKIILKSIGYKTKVKRS